MRGVSSVTVLLAVALLGAPAAGATQPAPEGTSHLGSTWDAPSSHVRVFDRKAVSATVTPFTERTPTDNPRCDLYTTTFPMRWQAAPGHKLTAIVTEDDTYAYSWTALDTATWTMSPGGQVSSDRAPVVQRWYRHGTHRPDPTLCPRDTRTVNHVEMYVDGPPRHALRRSIVKPPSRDHRALVWEYPHSVWTIAPARATVRQTVYRDTEAPDGLCEAHVTEIDLVFQAVGTARIIAVGERRPGEWIIYQNGDSEEFSRGVVAHDYFLIGTDQKSQLCPADRLSQDRIEIYTDVGRRPRR